MNYTFSRVAAYCGLRLSYYTTALLLSLAFLALVPTPYLSASPLYILLVLALAPSILKAMLFSAKKEATPLAFPLFCKKYGYEPAAHKSMNTAYVLLFILLAAWHISYSNSTGIPKPVTSIPSVLAIASLLTRILCTIGYRLYFRLFPLKAMH